MVNFTLCVCFRVLFKLPWSMVTMIYNHNIIQSTQCFGKNLNFYSWNIPGKSALLL